VRFIVEESLYLSNTTLSLDDRTHEYLLSVSVDESVLLRELREVFCDADFA